MIIKNLLTYSLMVLMLVSVSGCQSDKEQKEEERKIQGRLYASIEKANMDVKWFQQELDLYKLANKTVPTSEQGLKVLIDGKRIKGFPTDPWGNEYIYVIPGKHNPNEYDVFSKGPDGKADTEDDIGNWNWRK